MYCEKKWSIDTWKYEKRISIEQRLKLLFLVENINRYTYSLHIII